MDLEFERDFCIAINMMLGKSYEEAVQEAKEWVEEAHDLTTYDHNQKLP